jgi:hypothetical protein
MQDDAERRQAASGQGSTRELDRDALRHAIAQEEPRLATPPASMASAQRPNAQLAMFPVFPLLLPAAL